MTPVKRSVRPLSLSIDWQMHLLVPGAGASFFGTAIFLLGKPCLVVFLWAILGSAILGAAVSIRKPRQFLPILAPLYAALPLAALAILPLGFSSYYRDLVRIFVGYFGLPPLLGLSIRAFAASKDASSSSSGEANWAPRATPWVFLAGGAWLAWLGISQEINLWSMGHVLTNLLHNMSRGLMTFSQSDRGIPIHIFGWHVYPGLYLLAPFYWIFPGLKSLYLWQTAGLLAGLGLVYRLAATRSKDRVLPLALALGGMVSLPIGLGNLWAPTPIGLSFVFGCALLYFLENEDWKGFWISVALYLSFGEANTFVTAPLALYLFFIRKNRHTGTALLLLSLGYFFLCREIAVYVNHGVYFYQMAQERLLHAITNPIFAIQLLASPKTAIIFGTFLLAGSYLCIRSPLIWVAFPAIILNFLNVETRDLQYSYGYLPILPFFLMAGVIEWTKLRMNRWGIALLGLHLTSVVLLSAPTYIGLYQNHRFSTTARTEWIKREVSQIPKDASVSATALLESELSDRKIIYWFPREPVSTELKSAFQVRYQTESTRDTDFIAIDLEDPALRGLDTNPDLQALLANPNYGVQTFEAGLLILKRDFKGTLRDQVILPADSFPASHETPKDPLTLLEITVDPPSAKRGQEVLITAIWRVDKPLPEGLSVLLTLTREWPDWRFPIVHRPLSGLLAHAKPQPGDIFQDRFFLRLPETMSTLLEPYDLTVEVVSSSSGKPIRSMHWLALQPTR